MSLEQHAFLARDSVPSVADWQAAITELGFDLEIYPELKPFEHSGGVPCKLGSIESGFEIYYEPADELLTTYPHAKEPAAHRDYAISFRYFGDLADLASVLIAAAALAKSFHAVVYDPQDDVTYTVGDLVGEARQALAQIRRSRPVNVRQWQKLARQHLLPHLPELTVSRRWLFYAPIGWQVRGFAFERSGSGSRSFTIEAGVVPLYVPQSVGGTFRARLGWLARKRADEWWDLGQQDASAIFADIMKRIRRDGLPYLARRATVEAMTKIKRHQIILLSAQSYEYQAMLCGGILLDHASVVEREWRRFTSYHQRYATPDSPEWSVRLYEATEQIHRLYHDNPVAAREEIARWRIARAQELGLAGFLADEPADLRSTARPRLWWFGRR